MLLLDIFGLGESMMRFCRRKLEVFFVFNGPGEYNNDYRLSSFLGIEAQDLLIGLSGNLNSNTAEKVTKIKWFIKYVFSRIVEGVIMA